MTLITIDNIVAEQARLGRLIEALQQTSAPRVLIVSEATIELQHGERYAGLLFDANGLASHHVILLPGEADDIKWDAAKEWATKAGGELPTRQEQAMLFANLKSEFKPNWYWSGEQYEEDSSYAWYQYFGIGLQGTDHKSYAGRARAVRRFPA